MSKSEKKTIQIAEEILGLNEEKTVFEKSSVHLIRKKELEKIEKDWYGRYSIQLNGLNSTKTMNLKSKEYKQIREVLLNDC